jgi:hypothetical protein
VGNSFWTDGVPGVGTALNQTNMRKLLMGDGLANTGDLALGGATGLKWDDSNKRLGLGTDSPTQQLHLTGSLLLASTGNLLLGGASPGTSLAKGLVMANGTAPSGSHPADAVQCWAADQAAGHAALFLRTENGAQYTLGSNLGLFGTAFGTSADKVIALSSGTAPSGSHPADAIQLWSADRAGTAGKAGLHLRSEDGTSHVFADRVGIGTLTPSVALEVTGACKVTGNFACNNQTPASQQTYTASNVTTDRSFDANSTTLDEVADVLGTLIADLRTIGLVL